MAKAAKCTCGAGEDSPFRHAMDCPVFIAGHRRVKDYEPSAKFSVGDVMRTRDGRSARVVCVDADEPTPVVALVPVAEVPGGPISAQWAAMYRAYGTRDTDCGPVGEDLLAEPRRAVVWVAAQWGADGRIAVADAGAEKLRGPSDWHCMMKFEIEEGRFDE